MVTMMQSENQESPNKIVVHVIQTHLLELVALGLSSKVWHKYANKKNKVNFVSYGVGGLRYCCECVFRKYICISW